MYIHANFFCVSIVPVSSCATTVNLSRFFNPFLASSFFLFFELFFFLFFSFPHQLIRSLIVRSGRTLFFDAMLVHSPVLGGYVKPF